MPIADILALIEGKPAPRAPSSNSPLKRKAQNELQSRDNKLRKTSSLYPGSSDSQARRSASPQPMLADSSRVQYQHSSQLNHNNRSTSDPVQKRASDLSATRNHHFNTSSPNNGTTTITTLKPALSHAIQQEISPRKQKRPGQGPRANGTNSHRQNPQPIHLDRTQDGQSHQTSPNQKRTQEVVSLGNLGPRIGSTIKSSEGATKTPFIYLSPLFPKFSNLPRPLRHKIRKVMSKMPRDVIIYKSEARGDKMRKEIVYKRFRWSLRNEEYEEEFNPSPDPSILKICSERREAAMKEIVQCYESNHALKLPTPTLGSFVSDGYIFDPIADTLFILMEHDLFPHFSTVPQDQVPSFVATSTRNSDSMVNNYQVRHENDLQGGNYSKRTYDRNGYDEDGSDERGYNKDGYDWEGYNEEGYDSYGYKRQGYDFFGFDEAGNFANVCISGGSL